MINIILAGFGGQGLVVTTKIISDAAMYSGFDVKSNDVIGLSQRGGKVWGSVRFGEKVHSPNISLGEADYLLGFEPLEALRWSSYLKKDGKILINDNPVPTAMVMAEKDQYPHEDIGALDHQFELVTLDTNKIAKSFGTVKVANIILLGIMAKGLPISKDSWESSLKENVPGKFIEANLKAFNFGLNY